MRLEYTPWIWPQKWSCEVLTPPKTHLRQSTVSLLHSHRKVALKFKILSIRSSTHISNSSILLLSSPLGSAENLGLRLPDYQHLIWYIFDIVYCHMASKPFSFSLNTRCLDDRKQTFMSMSVMTSVMRGKDSDLGVLRYMCKYT